MGKYFGTDGFRGEAGITLTADHFAEKNPTSQKEEQAVPVAEESRTDNSDVPVYYESFAYAAENGEVDLYRISRQLNEDCRNAIEEAIADNFDGMHLADDATKSVVEQFGMALVRMIYGDSGWDKKMSYRLIGRAFPQQRLVSFKITDAMQIENGRVLTEM